MLVEHAFQWSTTGVREVGNLVEHTVFFFNFFLITLVALSFLTYTTLDQGKKPKKIRFKEISNSMMWYTRWMCGMVLYDMARLGLRAAIA